MKPYHFGHRINILGRVLVKRFQEKISKTGITSCQWSVIARLLHYGELTQTEICEQLSIEAPAISKTICNMETSGWVMRVVDENDKRGKKVVLTEKAKEHLPTWLRLIDDLEIQALKGIACEDVVTFNNVLERMLENLTENY
jgi:MarR family transcriptional regulator, transcriptional regulator for hemolysin